MDRIKITCNIFTKKMNDKSSPMLDLIDKDSVKTLIDHIFALMIAKIWSIFLLLTITLHTSHNSVT